MTEREMEDPIWEYPEKCLNEPLQKFERQSVSCIGRSDLIFIDSIGNILIIELKLGTLQRGAMLQLVDYFGVLKNRFPDKSVELMVIATNIPKERRLACDRYDIEAVEISEKTFRDVAATVGYSFKSETEAASSGSGTMDMISDRSWGGGDDIAKSPSPVEKAWYFWRDEKNRGYFLAFVNRIGSCSLRRFEANGGRNLSRSPEYKSGNYQDNFACYLRTGKQVYVSQQPNLERVCKERLPDHVLADLKRQVA